MSAIVPWKTTSNNGTDEVDHGCEEPYATTA
jgi:hypothetical protein